VGASCGVADEGFQVPVRMRENADGLRELHDVLFKVSFASARTRSRPRKSRWVPRSLRSRPREGGSHARERVLGEQSLFRVRANGFLVRESADGLRKFGCDLTEPRNRENERVNRMPGEISRLAEWRIRGNER
jgi:hypothetical protein